MKRAFLNIVAIVAGSIAISACSPGASNQKNGDSLSGDIKIDGSSTVFPVTEAMAEEFRLEQPDVQITVGVSGTGGGFQKFARGETDISNASRPIKDKEAEICRQNDVDFIQLTVAYDGLAVVANPENDWLSEITTDELKKIWEPAAQGVITRWNQIRPEWPDEEIRLYGPGVASGTFDYFTEAIVGESGSSRGDFTASEDDNVLVQGIAGDKYGLGFFGLAYFEENQDKLKLIAVDNGSGAVLPSTETVGDGSYSPLSRPVFIYVSSLGAQKPHVASFVHFYLDAAPVITKQIGYVPLPDPLYAQQKEKFEAFRQQQDLAAAL